MEMVADILLVAGALGAGLYCFILSRRLTRFTDLENGVGAAVAVLSAQVTDLQKALETAQKTATHSTDSLDDLTRRAEDAAERRTHFFRAEETEIYAPVHALDDRSIGLWVDFDDRALAAAPGDRRIVVAAVVLVEPVLATHARLPLSVVCRCPAAQTASAPPVQAFRR